MGEQRDCANRPLKQHMRVSGPLLQSVCGCDHHGRLTDRPEKVTCKLCIKLMALPKKVSPKRRLQHVVEILLRERRSQHEENHNS